METFTIIKNERTYIIENGFVLRQSGMPLRCSNCCKPMKYANNEIQMCECRKWN